MKAQKALHGELSTAETPNGAGPDSGSVRRLICLPHETR